jgi:hypothetical protein
VTFRSDTLSCESSIAVRKSSISALRIP